MLSNDEIRERDGQRCARCGTPETEIHHRFPRAGGTDESAANRVALCRYCHHWVHHNVALATSDGWIVRAGKDPAVVPVLHWAWPAGPILLLPDGEVEIWFGDAPTE